MHSSHFDAIRRALESAEAATWGALAGKNPDLIEEAHTRVREALKLVQDAMEAPRCGRPECSNPVPRKPLGRPALFCSRRCRDRTRYRESRQAEAEQR